MRQLKPTASGGQIVETMIELARCSRLHRIIVSGTEAPEQMFALHRLGYKRVGTTATSGLPCGQYDVALVDWRLRSVKALETTLDWLVDFLAPTGVLVVSIDSRERADHRKLGSMLEKLGFRVEAGTRNDHGLAISARRLDVNQQAIAA